MARTKFIQGKQKDVTDLGKAGLEFKFTDRTTVFDVKQPFDIPEKGITLALTNGHWFALAKELGIKTHFIGMAGPDRMIVAKAKPVDLEFIVRYYIEGDLWRRIQAGAVAPKELGFADGTVLNRGDKLPRPILENTTKRENTDRLLTEKEALRIGKISKAQLDEIWHTVLMLDSGFHEMIKESGLIHADGKKEVALKGGVMIVDSFGNADEDRYMDAQAYRNGKIVEKSKELFRRYYIDIGYHAKLLEARAQKRPDPIMPAPPLELVRQGTEMYKEVYERLTGKEFNPDNYKEINRLRRS